MTDTPTSTGEALQALKAVKAIEDSADKTKPASAYDYPRYDGSMAERWIREANPGRGFRAWIAQAHAHEGEGEP